MNRRGFIVYLLLGGLIIILYAIEVYPIRWICRSTEDWDLMSNYNDDQEEPFDLIQALGRMVLDLIISNVLIAFAIYVLL